MVKGESKAYTILSKSFMKEPTGWLYNYLKRCITLSVEKYPSDKAKWLGNPGVNRMKLWAMVLAKQEVIIGDLKTIENSANDLKFNTQRMFGDSSDGCIWPWEVDRVARQVLEHNPQFDAFPEQRRASEGARRKPIDLADYVNKSSKPKIEYIHRPGEQTIVKMTVGTKNEIDINDF